MTGNYYWIFAKLTVALSVDTLSVVYFSVLLLLVSDGCFWINWLTVRSDSPLLVISDLSAL